jgi:hypothetical protein
MICSLSKNRSPYRIEIVEDLSMDSSGWFLEVRWIRKKTKKIKYTSCIIRKDLLDWISNLKSEGWYPTETKNI